MRKVRITVLRTMLLEDLADDEAWKAIYQYVFALAHFEGDEVFYGGSWIDKPGVAICSCNDGLRPVIFKLERTDEEVPSRS